MLISALKFKKLPLAEAFQNQPNLFCQSFLINPDQGKVEAFIFPNQILLPFKALEKISAKNIFFRENQNLLAEPKNLIDLFPAKVFTKSNIYLGILSDFEFDDLSGLIANYYVDHPLFSRLLHLKNIIINRDQIVSIRQGKIIVQDSFSKIVDQIKNFNIENNLTSAASV